jgi:hypothetical protein
MHCIPADPHDKRIAPFPIVLYCLSTIDLLGALVAGRADQSTPTPSQSKEYMRRFMAYSPTDADILNDLFRHKLVHLAQPGPSIRNGSEVITWKHHHNDKQFHLKKIPYKQDIEIGGDVPLDWHIPVTHEFHISIMDLVKDIKDSTTKRPKDYLNMLEQKPPLRQKYQDAINQIYGDNVSVTSSRVTKS